MHTLIAPQLIPSKLNPCRKWYDLLPTILKAWFKQGKYHHSVIYDNYLILGAVPTKTNIKNLKKYSKDGAVIVSLLTNKEQKNTIYQNDPKVLFFNIPLFDHSMIDATTGLNVTYQKFKEAMLAIRQSAKDRIIYVHCMAGKSRSQIATIAYLYLGGIPKPKMPIQIARLVKTKRKAVKELELMEGDQPGFLGLMTLITEERRIANNKSLLIDDKYCFFCAQNIGLILKYPLDYGFRDDDDIKQQIEAFKSIYNMFKAVDLDLLQGMLIGIDKDSLGFEADFLALDARAKARFAILANKVRATGFALTCAKIALKQARELSVGDQIELLREFGKNAEISSILSPDKIKTRINLATEKNPIIRIFNRIFRHATLEDGYNSEIQLQQLFNIT